MDLLMLENMLLEKNRFNKTFQNTIENMDIPLEKRWEMFCYAVNNGLYNNPKSFIWHSKVLKEKIQQEIFDNYEYRGSLHDFPDIIESIEEQMDYDDECCYTHEIVDMLKEEMLSSGYSGFYYDW